MVGDGGIGKNIGVFIKTLIVLCVIFIPFVVWQLIDIMIWITARIG